jgi:serine/threonine protein kinase
MSSVRRTASPRAISTGAPRPGRPLDGRYEIEAPVGYGGAAVVYLAYDRRLKRKVALKVFRQLDGAPVRTRLRERVEREARAMASLAHRNVVTLYDAGEIQGHLFLSMEYVEGCSLLQWLCDRWRSWQEVLDLFLQAGQGLAAAHARGLVHCDFNPANVLVDRDGRARLIDFGLATFAGSVSHDRTRAPVDDPGGSMANASAAFLEQLTGVGHPPGTPEYMAPEQYLGQPLSPATDQFSFCVALHEALYGLRPFPGSGLWELGISVTQGRLRRVSPLELDGPAGLYDAVVCGLRTEPVQRYPSMAALLAALSSGRVES